MDSYIVFIGMIVVFLVDKCGLTSWISKRVHASLPREYDMAVRKDLKKGTYIVSLTNGETFTFCLSDMKFTDKGIVANKIYLFPWNYVYSVRHSTWNEKKDSTPEKQYIAF